MTSHAPLILAVLCLALCGCYDQRPADPVMESYQFRITDNPLPRAFREGRPWKQAGRKATAEEMAGCIKGSCSAYLPDRDVIQLARDGATLATLRHEQDHQHRWKEGVRDRAALERGGMAAEIRCLVLEQGWTVQQVRDLSRLNAAVSEATYTKILTEAL